MPAEESGCSLCATSFYIQVQLVGGAVFISAVTQLHNRVSTFFPIPVYPGRVNLLPCAAPSGLAVRPVQGSLPLLIPKPPSIPGRDHFPGEQMPGVTRPQPGVPFV